MIRRRRPGADRGSFTAELAAGLPALMLLLLAGLTAVSAVITKAQCVDAARDGALAAARGEAGEAAAARVAPLGARIQVVSDGDVVTVTVTASPQVLGRGLQRLTVRASAVAAPEPGTASGFPSTSGSGGGGPGTASGFQGSGGSGGGGLGADEGVP